MEVVNNLRSINNALLWYGVALGAMLYYLWCMQHEVSEIHAKTVVLPGEVVNKGE